MFADSIHLLGTGTTVNAVQQSPGVTATGVGITFDFGARQSNHRLSSVMQAATLQAIILAPSAIAVTGTVRIWLGNDGYNWLEYVDLVCPSTTAGGSTSFGAGATSTGATEGITLQAPWRFIRAELTAISGTGATAFLAMGVS